MSLTPSAGRSDDVPVVSPRLVVIAVFDGVQSLDVTGPLEVFAGATTHIEQSQRHRGAATYRVVVAGLEPGIVRTESGLGLVADVALQSLRHEQIDTLVLPGGDGVHAASSNEALISDLATLATHTRRVATVCTGTFVAGAMGLLDGRKVTTHWARARRLARQHPECVVDAEPIWCRDGNVWSSAGVTSGIDLALGLVEDDVGADVAQDIARWLVMFLRRPGGQSQFAAPVWRPVATNPCVRRAQDMVASDPTGDHRLDVLARRVGLSTRHFVRTFTAELGEPPGRYIERVRVETARSLLETTDDPVAAIARQAGFGSPETLRRAFVRAVGVPPDGYRRRFHLT
jgi:transcriptional regulator GlxA family with amidase domain